MTDFVAGYILVCSFFFRYFFKLFCILSNFILKILGNYLRYAVFYTKSIELYLSPKLWNIGKHTQNPIWYAENSFPIFVSSQLMMSTA